MPEEAAWLYSTADRAVRGDFGFDDDKTSLTTEESNVIRTQLPW